MGIECCKAKNVTEYESTVERNIHLYDDETDAQKNSVKEKLETCTNNINCSSHIEECRS